MKAKTHKFQRMMETRSGYDSFIMSEEFRAVRELEVPEERVWLAGAWVPMQIYSPLIWKDVAKALNGEYVDWIDVLPCRSVEGNTKRSRHLAKWIAIAGQVKMMYSTKNLQAGDQKVMYPSAVDPPPMMIIDQEVLLVVYTTLEKSATWEEFINAPELAVLADPELKEKHQDRTAVYKAREDGSISNEIYCFLPDEVGMVTMWIDVYDRYKIESGEPRTWLRMAGSADPIIGFKGMDTDHFMDKTHLVAYFMRFGQML